MESEKQFRLQLRIQKAVCFLTKHHYKIISPSDELYKKGNRKPSSWNILVKKVHQEARNQGKTLTLIEGIIEAKRRKYLS